MITYQALSPPQSPMHQSVQKKNQKQQNQEDTEKKHSEMKRLIHTTAITHTQQYPWSKIQKMITMNG
ncbi:hypothetical protein AMS64_21225 [Aeromonas veronii]|nr:hypothetical protein AMS64_21225 [Aeromonas veronii]